MAHNSYCFRVLCKSPWTNSIFCWLVIIKVIWIYMLVKRMLLYAYICFSIVCLYCFIVLPAIVTFLYPFKLIGLFCLFFVRIFSVRVFVGWICYTFIARRLFFLFGCLVFVYNYETIDIGSVWFNSIVIFCFIFCFFPLCYKRSASVHGVMACSQFGWIIFGYSVRHS